MIRRIAAGIVAVGMIAVGWGTVRYRAWLDDSIETLERGSRVVETANGPVEYAFAEGSGPVLVALHGTPGGYDQVTGIAALASEAGYRTLAISRPGFLRTPLSVGETPAEQADAVAGLLDVLDIPSAAVVGISGGGPASLYFAIRHPERCWALVDLMGVSRARLPGETHPADEMRGSPIEMLLGSNLGGWILSRLITWRPEIAVDASVFEEPIRRRILDDPATRAAFVELAASAFRLSERRNAGTANDVAQFESMEVPPLERIRVPTAVLHGTVDRNVPFAMGELVAERVPDAQLIAFEGLDHFMVVSDADRVFSAMFRFLDAHAPR